MVFEIVGHPCAPVTVVDGKEGELRVSLEVGEGGAPVLVRFLVALHVGDADSEAGVGAVVRVFETEGLTLTPAFPLLVLEGAKELVPPGLTGSNLTFD